MGERVLVAVDVLRAFTTAAYALAGGAESIILVAEVSNRVLAGFLEVDLRSHADGCNPSRPVGYIEGWYVAENHRHGG